MSVPEWAEELIVLYKSGAANQFILHGNVHDKIFIGGKDGGALGSLDDFLNEVLLGAYDVILTYDLANGLKVVKGEKRYHMRGTSSERRPLPNDPREAIWETTRFMRYCAHLLRNTGKTNIRVAVILKGADLVIPALRGGLNYDLNAAAQQVRDWSRETLIVEHDVSSFLITENLNDLHPLTVNNPRVAHIRVPLPTAGELDAVFSAIASRYPTAMKSYLPDRFSVPARQLTGATLSAVESLLKRKEHEGESINDFDLAELKKELVEKDCQGLIEFIDSDRTLDDVYGQEAIKEWLRQDIALWRQDDLDAMPMGYLLCGPVGTGKTYMVECLAGEAGVPVVKFKNFRDRWVGSTEGNLEKIFGLLGALGRCIVFIDEADQALGSRDAGSGDSGVSGRVYSMMAKEMSDTSNRGRIVWVLASSRPDLIEVDLKRPGRVDTKIPLFPSTTPEEGFHLIRALCRKQDIRIPKEKFEEFRDIVPDLVTPGAAEALAIRVYRLVKTRGIDAEEALRDCLKDYQNPVPADVLKFQIDLAIREASDLNFVPKRLLPEKVSISQI